MKTKILLLTALILAICSAGFAQSKTKAKTKTTLAPDAVVRNLYRAKSSSPFFQRKSRALVDKYFTKDLADSIWREAPTADGLGALDFDPLFHAQDVRITNFKIGKPEYGEGNRKAADVAVSFKNMGTAETILFRLEQDSRKIWKISNILYPSTNDTLKDILGNSVTIPK
jgi:hypothetical protein